MSAFPLPALPVDLPVDPSSSPAGPRVAKVRAVDASCPQMGMFPARWLAELPLPPRLGLHVHGIAGLVRIELGSDSVRSTTPADVDSPEVVFSRDEWAAVCRGVEADRIWPVDFAAVCARKLANPAYRLELDDALAGVQVDESELWALGRVLDRVDAHLVST
ncbi:MAG: hypothetical protein AB8I08_18275 [Sandaracinaceae bacterium]